MLKKRPIRLKAANDYHPGDIIIPAKQIDRRIKELAKELAKTYKGKQLVVVGLLKGAAWFTTDLYAALHKEGLTDTELTFMTVKSYPTGTQAQHEPRILEDMDINPKGRHVLLVDDISDTGKSLEVVEKLLKSRDTLSIASCVLLDKPERREVSYTPTFSGFTIPNIWVQGRGMDTNGLGRGDTNIITGPYTY